jgi:hypothetical protein
VDSHGLQNISAQGDIIKEADSSTSLTSDSTANISNESSSQTVNNPNVPIIVTDQNSLQSTISDEAGNSEITMPAETNNETVSIEKGLNYLSLYHSYSNSSLTDAVLERDFSRFSQDGITVISLSLYWYRLEGHTRGSYDGIHPDGSPYGDRFLANVKRVINKASQCGIKVLVTFHTLWGSDSPWCTPDYVVDPVSGKNIGLAIVRSDDTRQAFIDMFNHAVNYLAGTPGIWAWAILNEPWYWGRTPSEHDFVTANEKTQKENFIALFQELSNMVKTVDGRPTTIRFCNIHLWKSPDGVSHLKNIFADDWGWDQRIFRAIDFVSFNAYMPTDYVLQSIWLNMTKENLLGSIDLNNRVWITEIGCSDNSGANQKEAYEAMWIALKLLPVEGWLAWYWEGDAPTNYQNFGAYGKDYNLCASSDGTPGEAYYSLIQ